jgi:hypothetical protein
VPVILKANHMPKRRLPVAVIAKRNTEFDQMITSMRERLRPNNNRLFADYLRAHIGLSCGKANNKSGLLKILLQELSSTSVLQDA